MNPIYAYTPVIWPSIFTILLVLFLAAFSTSRPAPGKAFLD